MSQEEKPRRNPVHQKWSIGMVRSKDDDGDVNSLVVIERETCPVLRDANTRCRELASGNVSGDSYVPVKLGPTYKGVQETVNRVEVR